MKPLASWDGPSIVEGVAWWTRLDDRYLIEVQYDEDGDGYQGQLIIWDFKGTGVPVLQESTGIIASAIFGADVNDVERWQRRAVEVIDALALEPRPDHPTIDVKRD